MVYIVNTHFLKHQEMIASCYEINIGYYIKYLKVYLRSVTYEIRI